MQVPATISTKTATETGNCVLHLHLVSDHLHLPGARNVFFCGGGDVGSTAAGSERLEDACCHPCHGSVYGCLLGTGLNNNECNIGTSAAVENNACCLF